MAVVNTAWDGSASRFTDAQYAQSCALDRASCSAEWAKKPPKERCSLPIHEPNGDLNRNAVHAAVGGQGISAITDACHGAIAAAKSALRSAYKELGETPPESIQTSSLRNSGTFETRVTEAKREIRARSFDGIQRRSFPWTAELRDSADGGYGITGHGAVFNSLSENLGGFREQIMPGAFSGVLAKQPDVRALFNHDPNLILAGTRNGSLGLSEDATGLAYRAAVSPQLAATYYGQALRAQMGDGLVNQSSFAFRVAQGGDDWDEDDDTGALIRTIREFSGLYDVSPVTYPAYPAADSGLASSAPNVERNGDGPAGERTEDGDGEGQQADETPWRLKAVQRRMKLREPRN